MKERRNKETEEVHLGVRTIIKEKVRKAMGRKKVGTATGPNITPVEASRSSRKMAMANQVVKQNP